VTPRCIVLDPQGRKALGEGATGQQYIETVPARRLSIPRDGRRRRRHTRLALDNVSVAGRQDAPQEQYAFTVFERTFEDFGLPQAIRTPTTACPLPRRTPSMASVNCPSDGCGSASTSNAANPGIPKTMAAINGCTSRSQLAVSPSWPAHRLRGARSGCDRPSLDAGLPRALFTQTAGHSRATTFTP
jgi:hypothetical protein